MVHILILTSSSGAGHNRVAQVLAQALACQGNGAVRATIADPFQGTGLPSRVARLYGPTIVRAPWLWGLLYRLTDNGRWASALAAPLEGAVAALLKNQSVHLIVSVHPLCHGAALGALRSMGMNVPVAAMVTELLGLHAAWRVPGVSLFLVPTVGVARQLLAGGHPRERVHPLGLPVHRDFRNGGEHRGRLRSRLGLDPERPTILVTGGGEGAGPVEKATRTILQALPQVQMVVACGRNEALRRRLSSLGLPGPILGFAENMAQWMLACDVVVAKAGAVAVAEATAARRPLLIMDALPGQEEGNLRFVLESGIGAYAPPGPPLDRALRALQARDYRPSRWLENMARVDRPQAQDQAASLLLERVMPHG